MSWLAEFVDRLQELKPAQVIEANGQVFCDQPLHKIPEPPIDRPKSHTVNGLDSVVKLINTEIEQIGDTVMVQVKSHNQVSVFTRYRPDYSRDFLYTADADVPGFRDNFRPREAALIELRSIFVPNEGTEYLLDLLSRVSDSQSVVVKDNGVTQEIEAAQGIALKSSVPVKPIVKLKPYRTFLEVDQPESEFLFRVGDNGDVGLWEVDGGMWKLEAKQNIAAYFENELATLIYDGRVVVMM